MALTKSWSVLTSMCARRSILDTAAWLTRRIVARCAWVMSSAWRSSSRAMPERYLAARRWAGSWAAGDIFARSELKFLGTVVLLAGVDPVVLLKVVAYF